MAALLVGLSIMAVLMAAAMPTWRQIAQREKETELVFRGEQYARAISLYQKKMGPGTMPPNLDVLVEGRFLRTLYKDPITGKEFDLVRQLNGQPGASDAGRGGAGTATPGGASTGGQAGSAGFGTSSGSQAGNNASLGGIVGVSSKSKAESIRIYNGRTHYNEWQFVSVLQTQAPSANGGPEGPGALGGPGRGPGGPGNGRGGPGDGRGGPGNRGGGPQSGNPSGRGGSPFGPGSSPFGSGNPQAPTGGGTQSPFRPMPPE